jgi:hypothetical protein
LAAPLCSFGARVDARLQRQASRVFAEADGAAGAGAPSLVAYMGKPLSEPVHPAVMLLGAKAREGKLVVCAGAGLSVAPEAGLPSGQRLGELLNERLATRLEGYEAPENPQDLLAVADAAVDAIGGLRPLQYEALALAPFDGATPNYGHRALALLLVEGAVSTVLLWNWDTCVERSAPEGERIEVALTLDDIAQLLRPHIAKVHGCATRVRTLLITSEQLRAPPVWADAAFTAKLRGASAAFVGIGDVADYAKETIKQLVDEVPGLELDVFVVSPRILEEWRESVWAQFLPDLDPERRVAKTADAFFDELARLWASDLVDAVRAVAAELTGAHAEGARTLIEAMKAMCGADVIGSMRAAGFQHGVGSSVLRAPQTAEALVGLAVLAGDAGAAPNIYADGHCRVADEEYNLLILGRAMAAGEVRQEAFRRAQRRSAEGQIRGGAAEFVVAGAAIGPLNQPAAPDLGDGEVEAADVFMGPRGVQVNFRSAAEIVARAA